MFSIGRNASIDDVIIDTLGVIFGLFFVLLILKIIEIIKNKKSEKCKNNL